MSNIYLALVSLCLLFISSKAFSFSDFTALLGPNGEKILLIGDAHLPSQTKEMQQMHQYHISRFFQHLEMIGSSNAKLKQSRCIYEGQTEEFINSHGFGIEDIHPTFSELIKQKTWHTQDSTRLTYLQPGDGRHFLLSMFLQDFFENYRTLDNIARSQGGMVKDLSDSEGNTARDLLKRNFKKNRYEKGNVFSKEWFLVSIHEQLDVLNKKLFQWSGSAAGKKKLSELVNDLNISYGALKEEFNLSKHQEKDLIELLFDLIEEEGFENLYDKIFMKFVSNIADPFFFAELFNADLSVPQILILGTKHTEFLENILIKEFNFERQLSVSFRINPTTGIQEKDFSARQESFLNYVGQALYWVHDFSPDFKDINFTGVERDSHRPPAPSGDNSLKEIATCHLCGRTPQAGRSLQRCSRCKSVRYCSRECQAKDWPSHKMTCH